MAPSPRHSLCFCQLSLPLDLVVYPLLLDVFVGDPLSGKREIGLVFKINNVNKLKTLEVIVEQTVSWEFTCCCISFIMGKANVFFGTSQSAHIRGVVTQVQHIKWGNIQYIRPKLACGGAFEASKVSMSQWFY